MKRARRASGYEVFFQDLPAIDYEQADTLLMDGTKAGSIPVPDSWPANWPWLLALRDAIRKIEEHEQRAIELRHAAGAFREMFLRGDRWPTQNKEMD